MEMFVGPKFRRHRSVYFRSESGKDPEQMDVRDIQLADTSLPLKIINCLDSYGVWTLGQLADKNPEFIITMKNSGSVCLRLCEELLAKYNLDENFKTFHDLALTGRSDKMMKRYKKGQTLEELFSTLDNIF